MAADGVQTAQTDSVLAIRLHADGAIDTDSLLASLPEDVADQVSVEWQAAAEGADNDVWVLFRPQDLWQTGDVLDLNASALEGEDGAVVSSAYRFAVGEGAAQSDAIWQPEYGEDFDASGLNLAAEGNDAVVVTEAAHGNADSGTQPFHVGPERVFETPQRVWLPIPQGVDPDALQLYYHHAHGDAAGWYPAEEVDGWLVPDSGIYLEVGGETYYGFVVRHAGIVQLRTE